MKTTLYPYTRQELMEIRGATYMQQGCRVDGFTFRLWRPYDKIHVWLSEDDPRVGKDIVILKLRGRGIELDPADGFADDDLLEVLGALESRVLGRVTHGKPPAFGLAARLRAHADEIFDFAKECRHQPHYSRCLLGQGRVFWIVWRFGEVMQDYPTGWYDVMASGEAFSLEAAYQAAQAAVPGGHFHDRGEAHGASAHHHYLAVHKRLSCGSAQTQGTRREFLYRRISGAEFVPHLIMKQTKRRVYVDREAYNERRQAFIQEYPEHFETVVVDRATLERDGHARAPGFGWWQNTFYLKPKDETMDTTPACLLALQLTWPCTVKEVQRAFRQLVKRAHPDHGGNAEAFRTLRQAYEDALAWVKVKTPVRV